MNSGRFVCVCVWGGGGGGGMCPFCPPLDPGLDLWSMFKTYLTHAKISFLIRSGNVFKFSHFSFFFFF